MTTNEIRILLLARLSERDRLVDQLKSEPWLIVERRNLRAVRKEIVQLVGMLEENNE